MVLDAFGKWKPPTYDGENDDSDEAPGKEEEVMVGKKE